MDLPARPFRAPALPNPPHFSGTAQDYGERARQFLFLLALYFVAVGLTDDLGQLAMALSSLDGAALNWGMTCMAGDTPFTSFTQFRAAFTLFWTPLNDAHHARADLAACKQGQGTVQDYLNRFNAATLRIHPPLSNDEKYHRFREGLHPTVSRECLLRGHTTFEAASLFAIQWEQTAPPANPPRANNPAPTPANRPLGPRLNALPPADPAPTPANRPPGPRAPITPEQREYLQANNGCTYCRQLGHTITQCPLPRRRPNGPTP